MKTNYFKISSYVKLVLLTTLSISLNAKDIPLDEASRILFLQDKEVKFNDKNIKIKVPSFSDNMAQVPIFIDASYYKNAKKLVVFAEQNLIREILEMDIINHIPTIAVNMRVPQSSPLRVAVLDKNNIWHLASDYMDSEGGSCGVLPELSDDSKKLALMGKNRSKFSKKGDSYNLNFSIFHPMETGLLINNKTAFFINDIEITDNDKTILKIKTYSSISENPRFSFTKLKGSGNFKVLLKDTDGNDFVIKPKIKN